MDKDINAFITLLKETKSPEGTAVALKDNISTKGIKTTNASKMLENYIPVYNAAVVEKLESAGYVIAGKYNMDEFALGSSGETGTFGVVKNPWNVSHIAGDGGAAAIASGQVPLAIGTDSGGSLRKACSYCGVTGFIPTFGSVSRYGITAGASSIDQIGVMGQNIEDCAALLSVISGPDKRDSMCTIEKPLEFDLNKNKSIDGLNAGFKIGIPVNYFSYKIDEDIKSAVLEAAKEFENAGVSIEEFEMPLMDYVIPAFSIISCAEISSNFAKFDGLKYGYRSLNAKTLSDIYKLSRTESFGLEVKRKIMLGSFVLSSGQYDIYYKKALQARSLIKETYTKLFERFDLILSPVSPAGARKLNANINIWKTYEDNIFTAAVNLTGLPSVTLPCGFDKQGLPIGLQLIGSAFSEKKLIDIARIYQDLTDYHRKKPEKNSVPPCLRVEKGEKI
ncbi:MAG: aspartyl/glutamyl-tRNA amidotransferase subunit A [Treponema sp.]|nr:aspartyl/glutamyl-tRNA amidotransferase subunit A [Treponema sp.]